MNKRTQRILILTLTLIVTSAYSLSTAKERNSGVSQERQPPMLFEHGNVLRVIDGDTFLAEIQGNEHRVRMIGIDTPESVDPRRTVECFGKEASQKLQDLIGGKPITLESDPTQGEQDKYGRLLRYAYREGATSSVNAYMIAEGFAHEYTYAIPYRYQAHFQALEQDARHAEKGLWNPATCPQT